MIKPDCHAKDYLIKYKKGSIKPGLGINCELDEWLRFKPAQFNMVVGKENVGKTSWLLWYFLAISINNPQQNITWCVWSGENRSESLIRQLIEFYTGFKIAELSENQIYEADQFISHYFKFIDNKGYYTHKELLDLFEKAGTIGCLIDPFTGMNRDYSYSANYDFLNDCRAFCNRTKKTLYVNTHPNTRSAESVYPSDHLEWAGYSKPLMAVNSEGGQPFANRPDDIINVHRLVGHPVEGFKTWVFTRKIKETETGGKVMPIDEPVKFDYNFGRGFICNGVNPIRKITPQENPF